MIHGYLSSCNRMGHIAHRLSNLGYDIFASDLYGHGKSEG